MEFLLVRWAEVVKREDIVDEQGNITGMEAEFKYLEDKDVIVGGANQGKTNQTIELERGTHTIRLGAPQDFTPQNMKIVLKDTTSISPMEVRFEKL